MLPALQKQFKFMKEKKLNGSYSLAYYEPFACQKWLDGSFQQQYDKYLEDHIGFRTRIIRFFNTLDFRLFKKSHAKLVRIGKENYLYEERYINSYLGLDHADTSMLLDKIRKTKLVQDSLTARGVHLLVITAPGKGWYYPEYLPKPYDKIQKGKTNYEFVTSKFKEYGIYNIDFNSLFMKMKGTASIHLYPKGGVHWSFHSMEYVVDSLVKYIETNLSVDLPDLMIDSVDYTKRPRYTDYDIGDALNINYKIPLDTMVYPYFSFRNDSTKNKPKALFVGDSYYWQLSQCGAINGLFQKEDFWYYLKKVHRENVMPSNLFDLKTEVENSDLVILLANEAQSADYDFGFVTKMNTIFEKGWDNYVPVYADEYEKKVQFYIQKIKNDPNWLNHVIEKAKTNSISVDDMIRQDAEYMVEQERKKSN